MKSKYMLAGLLSSGGAWAAGATPSVFYPGQELEAIFELARENQSGPFAGHSCVGSVLMYGGTSLTKPYMIANDINEVLPCAKVTLEEADALWRPVRPSHRHYGESCITIFEFHNFLKEKCAQGNK